MKTLLKCQETMVTQQEIHYIFHTIKTITNSSVKIYQDKQIQVFLSKLILQEN